MPNAPLIDSRRARNLYALLTDELVELGKELNKTLKAYTNKQESRVLYTAITEAQERKETVLQVLALLSQGRFEEAEKELGLIDYWKKEE